jgi:ABC-type taurine transport system ATPase subunit
LSEGATLEAKAARIDLLGQPLLTRLDVTATSDRVALLGDWSPLFRLLAGEAELAAGSVQLGGVPAPLGVVQGLVGLMRLDPPLPAAWSGEQLLATGAELAGIAEKPARKLAFQTLERLGLSGLAARRLGHLQAPELRALLIAHAVITDPRILCLEQPIIGLDTHAEEAVAAVIERASAGRRLVVALATSTGSAASRQLVSSCPERLRLAGGVVVPELNDARAPTRVTATVCRNHHAFAAALEALGLTARALHEAGLLNVLTSPVAGPCWRYVVELPSPSTAPVLDAALQTEAGLVELTPLPND